MHACVCFCTQSCTHITRITPIPFHPIPKQAALVRSEVLLKRRLQELSHDLSDASLQQVRLLVFVLELMQRCCGESPCNKQRYNPLHSSVKAIRRWVIT